MTASPPPPPPPPPAGASAVQQAPRVELAQPISILLVEDNPGDVRLTQEALRAGKVLNRLAIARDGVEALAMLRREGRHADQARPDLILLDLNLPRIDGAHVLEAIKGDPDLAIIPVVVLTSSKAEEDIVRSYHMHANSYITKPVELERFMAVVRSVGDYWLNIVKLPPRGGA